MSAAPVAGPAPVVEARDLALVGPAGQVFAGVRLAVAPARLSVLVGPSGSGRSSLLLALCGRMRGVTGTLVAHGRPVRSRADLRTLRRSTSVARIAAFVAPEDRLSVGQSVVERALVDGVKPATGARAFDAATDLLDLDLDGDALVEELSGYDRTALAVALALVRPADLVVLDDVDADLSLADQRRLLDALAGVAATGPAVLVSSTEPTSVPSDARVLRLAPPAPSVRKPT